MLLEIIQRKVKKLQEERTVIANGPLSLNTVRTDPFVSLYGGDPKVQGQMLGGR